VTVRLRRAGAEDAALVSETLDEGFASYADWAPGWSNPTDEAAPGRLARRLASPDVWALIALDGDDVAGHVAVAEHSPSPVAAAPPGHAKLWQIFVRARWQGTGLATTLLREAEREAIGRGFLHMALWTPRDNMRARRFYEREGWSTSGREQEENPMGLPLVEYVREL
jgi:GNAT superfamily N-acetyltransferase